MKPNISRQGERYIDATVPLTDTIPERYDKIIKILDDFNNKVNQRDQFDSLEAYEKAKYVIANHIWLIYELLHLGRPRNIRYIDIKHFAINNNKFVKYVFRKLSEFSIDHLDRWTQPPFILEEHSMLR